jgi:hypothetical protein
MAQALHLIANERFNGIWTSGVVHYK